MVYKKNYTDMKDYVLGRVGGDRNALLNDSSPNLAVTIFVSL